MPSHTMSTTPSASVTPFQREQQAYLRRQQAANAETPAQESAESAITQALFNESSQDSFSVSSAQHALKAQRDQSIQDFIKKIQTQQALIKSSDIDDFMASNFADGDKKLAYGLLLEMTRFANMQSLNGLQSRLVQYTKDTESSPPIYYQGEGTLGGTLNYLTLKHKSNKALTSPFITPSCTVIDDLKNIKKGAILLDQQTKARLKNDPALCEHIRKHNIQLLYPQAWDEGINPFNQLSIEAITVKVANLLDIIREPGQQVTLNPRKQKGAIRQALSAPTRKLLKDLKLDHLLTTIEPLHPQLLPKPQQPDPLPRVALSLSQKICAQLAPNGIKETDLSAILNRFPDISKSQLALNAISEQVEIYSPLRLSLAAHNLHLKIIKYAKEHGIQIQNGSGDISEKIFYYIPNTNKSFGLVSMHYFAVNEIPPQKLINDKTQLDKVPPGSLLVVLDDIAGSGKSAVISANEIRKSGYKGSILLANTLSTTTANEYFNKMLTDPHTGHISVDKIPTFMEHIQHNAHKDALKNVVGSLSYDENGLSVAFPYMAPDNNNAFFATSIAPFFTLNKAGVKGHFHDPAKRSSSDSEEDDDESTSSSSGSTDRTDDDESTTSSSGSTDCTDDDEQSISPPDKPRPLPWKFWQQ